MPPGLCFRCSRHGPCHPSHLTKSQTLPELFKDFPKDRARIAHDCRRFLDDSVACRSVLNGIFLWKSAGNRLVMVCPFPALPVQRQPFFLLIGMKLPDEEALMRPQAEIGKSAIRKTASLRDRRGGDGIAGRNGLQPIAGEKGLFPFQRHDQSQSADDQEIRSAGALSPCRHAERSVPELRTPAVSSEYRERGVEDRAHAGRTLDAEAGFIFSGTWKRLPRDAFRS